MFGLFQKKKKPQTLLDDLIFSIYGNPPPAKRANVGQAIILANELLINIISEQEVSQQAIALNDGKIPYSTHDLALSIAMHFFHQPKYKSELFEAQLFTRLKIVDWLQSDLIAPVLAHSFEDVLYNLYKIG